jgi:hypothetical protein
VLLLLALLAAPPARAASDYALDSGAWNGLADLASIAEGRGLTVESRAAVRWSDIGPGDVLVILYPTVRVEPVHLSAFLRHGGRALIADDFGRASEALAELRIITRPPRRRPGVAVHDGNPNLPIAAPIDDHPLARGVGELVTNHPASFSVAAGPDVVFSYRGRDEAVVVAGQLGKGRFVALSDPSVLINAMLAFDGNLAFALNLLEFLAPDRPARLLVISGDARLAGEPPGARADATPQTTNELLEELSRVLDELNDYLAPVRTLRALGVTGGVAVLIAGALVLALRRGQEPDGSFARLGGAGPGPDRLLAELDREDGQPSYAYPAALLRESAEAGLEARVAAGEGGPAARALAAVRRLPPRALVVGQDVHVSRRTFVDAHAEVMAAQRRS